jgi:3-hydroxyacyl-CoA dehydrogenase
VTLIETAEANLDRGMKTIRSIYEATARRGGISAAEVEARYGRITPSLTLDDAAGADLVVEAVFEDMPLKREIFGKLDRIAKPGALLASNTSTLDIDEIARSTKRPESVVGMHFFSPANVMKLVEVVRGAASSKSAVATAMAVSRKLAKVPVMVGVCDGFVGNRMLAQRGREAERLLIEGALPGEVDKVLLEFGFPMGPFAMGDLAGLDVGYCIRQARGIVSPVADRLHELGRLGQKTGAGYFRYAEGDRTPKDDPEVERIIAEVAAERGINRRTIPADEILARLIDPMINEGARILAEGKALRTSDIDVIWVYGYGWPTYRGGPMYYADRVGLGVIRDRLKRFADTLNEPSLNPAPLLEDLVAAGKGFAEWRR